MRDFLEKLPETAQHYLEGRVLDEVECIVSDLAGVARGKAMPGAKFAKQSHFYLPNSIFFQTITGDWIDTVPGGYTEPDMVLTPDFDTATPAPWTADWTLQVIHNIDDQEGQPVPFAPRNVLKRVVALYNAKGWQPVVAPEMEFFLVAPNTDPGQAIKPPMGRSGRPAAARQAYSMSAVDEYGPVIDDIYDFAEAQGLEIDGILQEGGAGQIELNLRHGDPVRLADEIFFFKRLIREAALRHNCYATFMAKPIEGEPGSAMHIHHSIVDAESGANIFSARDGAETPAFGQFIAGMQRHLPSVIALLAPYVNSYRRYVPDFAAPINLEWGHDNRTTGIRIPVSDPGARRVENRLPGMDCNPYLGIAASLACGYLGLVEGQPPRPECQGDAYDADDAIPRGLHAALELFEANTAMADVLHPEFCRVYAAVKALEYKEFLQVISPWEREHLLLNV
ncbi:glutamine synthetase [Roseobacter sp. HKCCD9010]|uniref:glutamine synthetase family protein n=1 Tax=unclassified Roseobacter TaxID=196798 RepID=UPI001490CAFE|nr:MULTISPECIES: glutamine synthetase family protein [unclassified Roseobacter]MBF9051328.1 glutamine synthetase [Rhodobacterales bacterium HKCCD4356]NNV13375.1 glutamine synthetase [Roseobacter sp. HKCCD7357]NNV17626.1 glutamine synthetase [Roseobacter sp. HKCCD8768]NNV27232.1 glutamine synthetase [Roseobacter sp. HKCCD8192]NNV31352.1 glutamine synthetase [Roseobacter sp. HKCCD9061]